MPQKALFPMQYLRITQNEYGSYSHAGSPAMDLGGKDTGFDKVYAPCDMKIVRVRSDSSHETYAESVEPVLFADGTVDFMNFTFMHDNYLNSNCKAELVLQQGTYFFDEGGFGGGRANKFASHLHLEVGKGKSPKKQAKNSKGVYMTPGGISIYKALWAPADCKILNGMNHPWRTTSDKLLDTSGNAKGDGGQTASGFKKYNVRPTARLNIRKGPGTNYAKVGLALPQYLYTVLEAQGKWGRTSIGWICLSYTKAV